MTVDDDPHRAGEGGRSLTDLIPGMRRDAPKRNVLVALLALLVCLLLGGLLQEVLALPFVLAGIGRQSGWRR